ncbi:hypothetical protein PM080_20210 [Mycobacteroides abscessus subsp. abscessus]|nr:hypothetical protein [Mycobacteroides abscessus subsp. abscessus]MDB2201984.1 hypothetical protein [Mycobacteroides abscessus subsp. abscessus]
MCQKPARIWPEVMASTAPPVIAHHLGLAAETPALMVVLRLEDKNGRTIEWIRAFGRPDEPLAEEVLDLATGLWSSA